jgi:hypothetical protein
MLLCTVVLNSRPVPVLLSLFFRTVSTVFPNKRNSSCGMLPYDASLFLAEAGKSAASLEDLPKPLPPPKLVSAYGTSVVVSVPPFKGRISFEVSEYHFLRYTWRSVSADLVKAVVDAPGHFRVEGLLYDGNYSVKATYHDGGGHQASTPPSDFMMTLTRVEDEMKTRREFYSAFEKSKQALTDDLNECVQPFAFSCDVP